MLVKEGPDIIHDGVGDMGRFLADGRPAVGVYLVSQRPQLQPHVAVGLVEVVLLKLLDHHLPLHLQPVFVESQTQHPVRLEPETGFDVLRRQREIVVSDVGAGEGVVLAPHPLQRLVVRGDVDGAAEHEVLKQVGKACMGLFLVAGTHVVHHVQHGQGRGVVLVHDHPQPVI